MKIGSLEAPGWLLVTVSEGMRKSGRVCHVGGLGGPGLGGVRALATISAQHPAQAEPNRSDSGGAQQLSASERSTHLHSGKRILGRTLEDLLEPARERVRSDRSREFRWASYTPGMGTGIAESSSFRKGVLV